MLHLSESADRAIRRDRLHVQLRVETTAGNPKQVQADINRRMASALAKVKTVAGVKPETGSYAVYEERQQNDGDRAEPSSRSKYESPVAQSALELYLGGEALPEIAAVDKAGELIRDLLPQVKDEASPEITQAVKTLSASQDQVCQHARNARPTLASLP